MKKIDDLHGEHFFLDNFFVSPTIIDGKEYMTNEHYFQSMKCADPMEAEEIRLAHSPGEAKALGQVCKMCFNWQSGYKYCVMFIGVFEKFQQNHEIRRKLLATEGAYLEEGNTWGDRIWGTVDGKGQNALGLILMIVRDILAADIAKEGKGE